MVRMLWPSTVFHINETGTRFDDIYGSKYEIYGKLTTGFMEVSVINNATCTFTAYRSNDHKSCNTHLLIKEITTKIFFALIFLLFLFEREIN